ncbi:hypothetical protein ARMGADRAFT_311277 [Armillaria gallica]|uniref:Uncharacterized protein n=1 Tax=Armillaria gallica TaxID=47427 RepID=A0A2H3DFN7_ARMGA|nr:hypothetical protein ARMGADRAFT_311277 [Armillaria gallica]
MIIHVEGMGRRYGPVHTFLAGTLSSDIFCRGAYRLWVWTPPFQYEMQKLAVLQPDHGHMITVAK